MRVPVKAPKLAELAAGIQSLEALMALAGKADGFTVDGQYLHWDKLRYLKLQKNTAHRDLWAALKFRREAAMRSIPLCDSSGNHFRYCTTAEVQEDLLFIDQNASGRIEMPDQITNPQTRDRYVISSLIEEAIRSSQLEGAATTRQVAKEMLRTGRQPMDVHEKMILNNFNTMRHICSIKDQDFSPKAVLDIHGMVTEGTLENTKAAGRLRKAEEKVRVFSSENDLLHVPPPAGELPKRLKAMCAFANGKTPKGFLHPVLRAVILHFWLAYDHPFVDGNGRTARALFYWSMLREKYWLSEFISISHIMRNAPAKYARAFLYTETDENDLTYFIVYHLKVVKRAIEQLFKYVSNKAEELRQLERKSRKLLLLNHRQKALVSHALRHPDAVYTFQSHRQSHGVVRETARRDLLELAKKKYLEVVKVGRIRQFYPAGNLADLLRS